MASTANTRNGALAETCTNLMSIFTENGFISWGSL